MKCNECGETCTEDEKHMCESTHEFMDAMEHNMEAAKQAFGESHAFHATLSVFNSVFADVLSTITKQQVSHLVSHTKTTTH